MSLFIIANGGDDETGSARIEIMATHPSDAVLGGVATGMGMGWRRLSPTRCRVDHITLTFSHTRCSWTRERDQNLSQIASPRVPYLCHFC